MSRRTLTMMLMLFAALWFALSGSAQENLLQNPGFNGSGNYVDQRPQGSSQSFAIAPGWNGWQTRSPSTQSWMNLEPIAFPHTSESKREGDASQNIGRGDATFTAAVYQTVGGVAEGNTYRFSVWVFQDSEGGSGSQTRVGIGSNVGGNPLGSPITWSPWMRSIDSWQEVTVEATVPAGSITVFIYSTQSSPRPQNQNYYDDASLILVSGEGAVDVGDGDGDNGQVAPPPPPTTQPFAPFVAVQPTQESGEVVHTVVSGDTLAAISVAYGVPADEILALNGLTRDEARFLRVGQRLIISEGDPNAEVETDAEVTEAVEPTADTEDTQNVGFASPTPIEAATEDTVDEEPTSIPTPTPAEEEASATPEVSPTPSEIPATPTDAPTAPVVQAQDTDPLAIDTGVCTLMFDDLNVNNIQDGEETLLSGGQIVLSDADGNVLQEYVTDGTEPYCFEELSVGDYTMRATAPDGYGLTTALRAINIQAGQVFTVRYAAVEGLEVTILPTVNVADPLEPETIVEEEPDPLNNLRNIAGILVLGIAGAVLLGGIVVGVLVRGR